MEKMNKKWNKAWMKSMLPCVVAILMLVGVTGCFKSKSGINYSTAEIEETTKATAAVTGQSTPARLNVSPAKIEEASIATSAAIGQIAPSFVLLDQDEKPVRSLSLRGSWVVLYFYPKDDTPGCACEATEFTELLTEFRQMNAKVYGINQDTLESHRMFRKKYGLELDLLSDPTANTMRSYGAYVDSKFGVVDAPRVIRTTFLIDPKGRVRSHWPEVIPEGHAERVKNKLKQLQAS